MPWSTAAGVAAALNLSGNMYQLEYVPVTSKPAHLPVKRNVVTKGGAAQHAAPPFLCAGKEPGS